MWRRHPQGGPLDGRGVRVLASWNASPEERAFVEERLPVSWLSEGIDAEAEALLTLWPRRELHKAGVAWDQLPNIQLVKAITAGVNHIGWKDIPEHVQVAATPGATADFIAEYVLGAIISWARGMPYQTREIRQGRFHVGAPTRALKELRVGLVGYGGIGQATAKLLAPFGCQLAAVSRSGQSDVDGPLAWLGTMADLPTLVAQSDVVVLCLPLHKDTVGLVDLDLLSGMSGRHVLLVNVARGAIIHEPSLFAWLDSDATRHWACLDVWWKYEDRPFTEAFETLPNVIMTPHNAPNVGGFRFAMLEQACAELRHWLDTGEVLHLQDRDAHLLSVEGDGR